MAGSEGGDGDVNSNIVGLILFEVGIDDFERVVFGDLDLGLETRVNRW